MIHEIDAIGLLCPLPVLKARKKLNAVPSGDYVHLLATDPAAVIDVPHFCNQTGHVFISSASRDDGSTLYVIQAK